MKKTKLLKKVLNVLIVFVVLLTSTICAFAEDSNTALQKIGETEERLELQEQNEADDTKSVVEAECNLKKQDTKEIYGNYYQKPLD